MSQPDSISTDPSNWIVILDGLAYRREGETLVSMSPRECAKEIQRLRDACRMIATETLCPELWPEKDRKDWSEDELAHRTAVVIAMAVLEPAQHVE